MFIKSKLTKEESTQKKIKDLAREEAAKGSKVKVSLQKLQIKENIIKQNRKQQKLMRSRTKVKTVKKTRPSNRFGKIKKPKTTK